MHRCHSREGETSAKVIYCIIWPVTLNAFGFRYPAKSTSYTLGARWMPDRVRHDEGTIAEAYLFGESGRYNLARSAGTNTL